jgi:hypothetical protein
MAAILSNPKARAAMTGSSKAFKRKASLVTVRPAYLPSSRFPLLIANTLGSYPS